MSGLIRLNEVWDGTSGIDEQLIYTPQYNIKEDYLTESSAPEVDGKIILGKITGPFFFGDGISRNKRFYPRALWEKQLSDPVLRERLTNKTCLGTVGHYDGPVTEQDVSSGKVSHITSSLRLGDNNVGIGEALILNTEAGRNIYTLFKAGSRIKVSSRAQGKFLEGETHNGLPIVDPNSFILEGFDWVINPGFIETDPRLQESLKEITARAILLESKGKKIFGTGITINENSKKEKLVMEFNEQLLSEARSSVKMYESMYKEQKSLREEAEEAKKEAEKECEKCKEELKEAKAELAAYKALGEAAEIAQDLREYAELGFTSPTEARFVLESLKEEAEGAIDAEEVEDIKKDIEEACELLAKYEELGTPEELKDIKDKAEELTDELDKKEKNESIARLVAKFGISESIVRKFVEATEDEEEAEKEIEEALEGMADPVGGDDEIEDHEQDLPNKVNDNEVEFEPNVVEEALEEMLSSSKGQAESAIMEGYKPASIVNSMFS